MNLKYKFSTDRGKLIGVVKSKISFIDFDQFFNAFNFGCFHGQSKIRPAQFY